MDRRTGSTAARRGIAAALLISLAGCGGHRHVQVGASTPVPPPQGNGLSVSGSVHSPALNTLIVLGVLLGIYHAGESEAVQPGAPDPSRRVSEQDCTRPIEDAAANLKCR